jgi:cyclophilin family peptidyl-prolyl cis-trans isomerase/HEAT repeat protein
LRRARLAAAWLSACLAVSCGRPPERTAAANEAEDPRTRSYARLLESEDSRTFNEALFRHAAASPDPWLRSKAALAAGRLRDREASALLPPLLRDAEAVVRRSAVFAAGVSGDRTLTAAVVLALTDPDPVTAANAAEALGKLGGGEAMAALVKSIGTPGGARAAAARALFRADDPRVVDALAAVALDPGAPADVHAAAVYALARRPKKEGLSALRAVLRKGEGDESAETLAWAVRSAGLLADTGSAPDLIRLAGSSNVSVAVQALAALERVVPAAGDDELAASASGVGSTRSNDDVPGVAVTALRLLGALPATAASRAALEENLLRRGWRGETALVSLTRLDAAGAPLRAANRLLAAAASSSPELKLGAAEALELLAPGAAERAEAALLADSSPRVRAAALSSIAKKKSPNRISRLAAGLRDSSPSVRAVALEASAPLVDGEAASLLPAWTEAFEKSFRAAEPDDVVAALDAAVARGEAGKPLVAARVDDAEPVVREKARRAMVVTWHASPAAFRRIPVKTGRTGDDYRELAKRARGFGAEVAFVTPRGTFAVALDFEAAPVTSSSFLALAEKGFFAGLLFHRVVPDFVVQTGDPRGDGTGGPGFSLRDEINPLRYGRGTVGMALSGPDTGGSQWFVALSPQPHLDGGYTAFGHVVSGMDVLDRLEQDDRIVSVRIRRTSGAAGTKRSP